MHPNTPGVLAAALFAVLAGCDVPPTERSPLPDAEQRAALQNVTLETPIVEENVTYTVRAVLRTDASRLALLETMLTQAGAPEGAWVLAEQRVYEAR